MNAPDRIFAIYGAKYGWGDGHCTDTLNNGSPTCGMATEYVRADLYATQASRTAELEAALSSASMVAGDHSTRLAKSASTYHGGSDSCAHYKALSNLAGRIAEDIRALSTTPSNAMKEKE